jgi:peroxiredoxin
MASVYEEIKALGAELWSIAPQSIDENSALRRRRHLPFPILADDGQAVIHRWGLFNDLDPKRRAIPYPATYIVGQRRRVRWSKVSRGTRDRPTSGEIVAALKSICANELSS